jgi:hypothetical protein
LRLVYFKPIDICNIILLTLTLSNLDITLKKFHLFQSIAYNRSAKMSNLAFKPEVVLSKSNRKACIEKLKYYKVPIRKNVDGIPQAAVLVPLCLYKGELGLVYTLRSMKLTSNKGQVI